MAEEQKEQQLDHIAQPQEQPKRKKTLAQLMNRQNKAQWFVVHTYSGHENKVKINLDKRLRFFGMPDMVEEIYIPTQDKIEVKDGKRRDVVERLFPGYILVKMVMSDELFTIVKDTPGVTGFVGTTEEATPLTEEEVAAIKIYSEQDAPQYESQFSLGEGVKIIDGPFNDFIGTIDTIDEAKGTVKVLINIFGRETPVELDFLQIGKL
jgi:transcriptional antiterminator NusG